MRMKRADMIVKNKHSLTSVYLPRKGAVERESLWWILDYQRSDEDRPEVSKWLLTNAVRGRSLGNTIHYLKGDDYGYTVIKFADEAEAILFQMEWDERGPEHSPEPASATSTDAADDTKGLTFQKTNSWRFYKAPVTTRGRHKSKRVTSCYGSERDAAGYYVAWQSIDGRNTDVRLARRKKKDVIAWARKRATTSWWGGQRSFHHESTIARRKRTGMKE